ncbi:MAG: GNAT family protein [Desulfobacteraceae bacterium]|nr:GNAT family protein [Desulfobacteraceae bacterium]
MAVSSVIHTVRLRIVPFEERHLTARYLGWLNDPDVVRYSEQRHRTHTMESCRAYFESFRGTSNYFWAIEETAQGHGHIGNLNAYVDIKNLVADMGIIIGEKRLHGHGYGREALDGICCFLLKDAGLRKVTVGMMAANRPMINLARGLGMVEDGVRRRHFLFENHEEDMVHFAMFKGDIS